MKIIADEDIPFVRHYFKDAILIPGRSMTQDTIKEGDILLVRSITLVNKALLNNTAVKFVGSVTTGLDHIDIAWLQQANIEYTASLGFNAVAVAEYVLYSIAYLQQKKLLRQEGLRAAVIGVGRIGSLVVKLLELLNFEVICCDPLRGLTDLDFRSTALEDIQDVDLVTLHTPLTKTGAYPTFHMIQQKFLTRQKTGCVLLNTSRGSVIAFEDLKKYGKHLTWCLDVWENEPNIDLEVLANATLATPHIAGYSLQAQYRGIAWIYQAMVEKGLISPNSASILAYPTQKIVTDPRQTWQENLLQIYNPEKTSQQMKSSLGLTLERGAFDELRKNYPVRCELIYTRLSESSDLFDEFKRILRC